MGRFGTAGWRHSGTELAVAAPFLWDRTAELTDWDQVKLLSVAVDRLRTWFLPGLLCIGDSAHAMSPVGGVGINLGDSGCGGGGEPAGPGAGARSGAKRASCGGCRGGASARA